jgi:hypothetical protein
VASGSTGVDGSESGSGTEVANANEESGVEARDCAGACCTSELEEGCPSEDAGRGA